MIKSVILLVLLLIPKLVMAQSGSFDFQSSLAAITPSIVPGTEFECSQYSTCENGLTLSVKVGPDQEPIYQPNNYVSTIDNYLPAATIINNAWTGNGTNPVGFYSIGRNWGKNSQTWLWNSIGAVEPGATNGLTEIEYDWIVSSSDQHAVGGLYVMASDVIPTWSPVLIFRAYPTSSWSTGIISEDGAARQFAQIGTLRRTGPSPSQPILMNWRDNKGVEHESSLQMNAEGRPIWSKLN